MKQQEFLDFCSKWAKDNNNSIVIAVSDKNAAVIKIAGQWTVLSAYFFIGTLFEAFNVFLGVNKSADHSQGRMQ